MSGILDLFKWLRPKLLRAHPPPQRGAGADQVVEFFKEKFDTWVEQLKSNQLCEVEERPRLKEAFNALEGGLGDVLADENATVERFDIAISDFSDDQTKDFVTALKLFWDIPDEGL